jgi:hypothetical protein
MAGDIADDREPDAIGDELLAGNGSVQSKKGVVEATGGDEDRGGAAMCCFADQMAATVIATSPCAVALATAVNDRSRPASRRAIHGRSSLDAPPRPENPPPTGVLITDRCWTASNPSGRCSVRKTKHRADWTPAWAELRAELDQRGR